MRRLRRERAELDGVEHFLCTGCNAMRPRADFNACVTKRDKIQSYCKTCQARRVVAARGRAEQRKREQEERNRAAGAQLAALMKGLRA